jgi:hypothetical protein
LFPKLRFLNVEVLYVHEQFKYHDFLSADVVLTQEHVVLVHYGCYGWWSSVMLSIMFSTQQFHEVPFFVHELFPKLRFLKVALLYVHEQFKYHDFLSLDVVLTQEQVEFVHIGGFCYPLLGPGPLLSVMLSIMFSTQQFHEVPFLVQELLPKLRFLKVALL